MTAAILTPDLKNPAHLGFDDGLRLHQSSSHLLHMFQHWQLTVYVVELLLCAHYPQLDVRQVDIPLNLETRVSIETDKSAEILYEVKQ